MCCKCSKCDHTADQAGDCPTCNIPMEEKKEEVADESVRKPSEDSANESAK